MEESPKMIWQREIEEYYKKEDGVVYYIWRFANERDWRKEETPYKEIPIVKWRPQE